MPALDLALGHRLIRRAADLLYVLAVEPFRQVNRDVAGIAFWRVACSSPACRCRAASALLSCSGAARRSAASVATLRAVPSVVLRRPLLVGPEQLNRPLAKTGHIERIPLSNFRSGPRNSIHARRTPAAASCTACCRQGRPIRSDIFTGQVFSNDPPHEFRSGCALG